MRLVPLASLLVFAGCLDPKDSSDSGADTADSGGDSGMADSGDTGTWDGGGPMTDPSAADGKTYSFLFSDATISQPATLGAIIAAYMNAPVLLNVTAISDSSVSLRGGLGLSGTDPIEQDTCAPTYDFPSGGFDPSDPTFTVGSVDAQLYVQGVAVPVYGVELTATFAADASAMGNLVYTGLVDTRPIGPLLNGGGGDDAVCVQAKNFGLTCVDCPNDIGTYCLTLVAEDIVAAQVSTSVTEVASGCD